HMPRHIGILLFVLSVAGLLPLSATALTYDPRGSKAKFGAKIGFVYSMNIRITPRDSARWTVSTDPGLTGGVFLDIPMSKHGVIGVAVDLYDIQVENFRERRKFFDGSITVKRRFPLSKHHVEFRPGLGVGFGYIAAFADVHDPTSYLMLKGGVEMLFNTRKRFAWMLDLVVIGSPVGGNNQLDITFGPTFLARIGVFY
ncbi:MAG: hypothetical protein D6800_13565, partial [Candidatus Zixiibacteriota bacterium]